MNRYSSCRGLREVLFLLDLEPWGAAAISIAPREHGAVAEALEEALEKEKGMGRATRVSAERVGKMEAAAGPLIVCGLPPPGAGRVEVLARMNGRRDWWSAERQCVLVLLDPGEMVDFQRYAGDLWAAPSFRGSVGFVPDASVNVEEARRMLAEYIRHRYGRLDLRGFVRSESEDVAFRVEDVFVEVPAGVRPVLGLDAGSIRPGEGDVPEGPGGARLEGKAQRGSVSATEREPRPVLSWVEDAVREPGRPLVVLGAPGAGKTFLLRWLALRAVSEQALFDLESPFPVLVSLAAFSRAPMRRSLFEHVAFSLLEEGQAAGHAIWRMMEEGRVLFLLDGLDEVNSPLLLKPIREGIRELRERGPRCPIVMTSRIAGYERDPDVDPIEVVLSELDDDAIRRFLSRWGELYAMERRGGSDLARSEGRREGERLAEDVMGNRSVRQIAGNPLLLTVLAVVHRAGVRLPEHRAELYDHASRVLVERWNRVRSAEGLDMPPPPLRLADAVRLLGPLALRMVRQADRSTVSVDVLREELGRVLETGALKGLASVDEAIALFQDSLGILVEQAPGVFGFLHLTFGEFFAAQELVRTGELEKVAADPARAFQDGLRETLLLGAGILGVLRAEDARLAVLVDNLLASAARESDPTSSMPALLWGLLSDDPGLTSLQRDRILDSLVPGWWFERWLSPGDLEDAAFVAVTIVSQGTYDRPPAPSAHGDALSARLWSAYGESGLPPALRRRPVHFGDFFDAVYWLWELGRELRLDFGPLLARALGSIPPQEWADASEVEQSSVFWFLGKATPEGRLRFNTIRALDESIRSQGLPLAIRTFPHRAIPELVLPLASTTIVEDDGETRTVSAQPPEGLAIPEGTALVGFLRVLPRAAQPSQPVEK